MCRYAAQATQKSFFLSFLAIQVGKIGFYKLQNLTFKEVHVLKQYIVKGNMHLLNSDYIH